MSGNYKILDLKTDDVTVSSHNEAMASEVGEVYLVRSSNIPNRGDHFILVCGGLVQKPHGLRPEVMEFPLEDRTIIDEIDIDARDILLRLNEGARERFYNSFNIPVKYRIEKY